MDLIGNSPSSRNVELCCLLFATFSDMTNLDNEFGAFRGEGRDSGMKGWRQMSAGYTVHKQNVFAHADGTSRYEGF
jgi:hypothetical protein